MISLTEFLERGAGLNIPVLRRGIRFTIPGRFSFQIWKDCAASYPEPGLGKRRTRSPASSRGRNKPESAGRTGRACALSKIPCKEDQANEKRNREEIKKADRVDSCLPVINLDVPGFKNHRPLMNFIQPGLHSRKNQGSKFFRQRIENNKISII